MDRYWDLTEKQRSLLTAEQIDALSLVEMMEKGCLDPGPAPALDTKAMNLPLWPFYRPEYKLGYSGRSISLAFATAEAAEAFIKLAPLVVDHDYQIDADTVAVPESWSITQESIARKEAAQAEMDRLRKVKAHNEANKKAIEAHAEAVKKKSDITKGVWDDWHRCRGLSASYGRVVETYTSYQSLASGDKATAYRFLAKAYSKATIDEAFEWHGLSVPADEAPF